MKWRIYQLMVFALKLVNFFSKSLVPRFFYLSLQYILIPHINFINFIEQNEQIFIDFVSLRSCY